MSSTQVKKIYLTLVGSDSNLDSPDFGHLRDNHNQLPPALEELSR